MIRWILIVSLVLLVSWQAESLVSLVDDVTSRGKRLTRSTMSDGRTVDQSPDRLYEEASAVLGMEVDATAYDLARVIRSERLTGGNNREATAIAWVAINDMRSHGWSNLYAWAGPDYRYGVQKGWRFSTARDPYEADYRLALACLSGQIPDPTGGATHYVHIRGFGPGGYEDIVERWGAQGLAPVLFDEQSTLTLFVPRDRLAEYTT